MSPNTMNGKICMVTGANSGIGLETARQLAEMGAHVIMVCRNKSKGEAARASIMQSSARPDPALMLADLASLEQVRHLAADFLNRFDHLDVLIHNAGIMKKRREESSDGFELQFAVHHLAPFLLTHLLMDALLKAGPGRVVSLASMMHRFGRLDFDDLQAQRSYNMVSRYGSSKLANIMFTYQLAEQMKNQPLTVNCLHPGVVGSNIEANPSFIRPLLKSPRKAARTPVYLASSPEVDTISGRYFIGTKPRITSKASCNQADQQRLWNLSAELTGVGMTIGN